MHVAEFLNRTNRRNRNAQIEGKVQRRLGECARDLEQRRRQLAEQLNSEQRQLDEELAELLQARLEAAQNQRIEWIQMALMRGEREEQELLQLKQQQREIENSEKHRESETKQILLETKRAQLYQIEERKELRRRAAYLDSLWQQYTK
ncbi:PH domain-containing protein DDB_G0287875 [Drosophila montana]|uniref:PH domain-containing protein DDB_G0287875 n=1 Tax=Drosophila montana TaxID=40370 RepID=UPI00313F1D5B